MINLKGLSKKSKIIISLLSILVALPIIMFLYFYIQINSMYESVDFTSINKDTIDENTAILDDNITNILLIGTDGRNKNDSGRSDSIMIATLDEKHKCIKLTSIARDTYVEIPNRGKEKINHAYSYGGVPLLIETIEKNLGVGISKYATVDFTSFIGIIDALGGISLTIKEKEISEVNKYIPECYEASSKNKPIKLIENTGTQTLNGYQALSYARIRKNDSGIARDERQRKVLQAILNEASNMSFSEATKLVRVITPYVKTNIKPVEALELTGKILKINNLDIQQLSFPMGEYSTGGILKDKGWVLQFDKGKCLQLLHKFIFGNNVDYVYIQEEEYVDENTIVDEDLDGEHLSDEEIEEIIQDNESLKPPSSSSQDSIPSYDDNEDSQSPETIKPINPPEDENNQLSNEDVEKPGDSIDDSINEDKNEDESKNESLDNESS